MKELKTPKSSLRNNIIVTFFLIIIIWGIFTSQFLQNILHMNLSREGLDKNIIEKICRDFTFASTGFTVLGIFVVLLIGLFLSNRITKPLKKLDKGTKIISSGNLDHKVNITTNDELEHLAGSFNKMAHDLKIYIKNLRDTTAEKERIESELKIAHDIQMGIVPKTFPAFPERPEFNIYAVLKPAREVGGDFYDFFFTDDVHLYFAIGDVSGKGIPAALFMAVAKTLIKSTAREVLNPEKVITIVNNEIVKEGTSGMFVTLFCGVLNTRTGEVDYINCGHNPPLVIRRGKGIDFLPLPQNTVVGIKEKVTFKKEKLLLGPYDSIYMYTDGVTEAFNKKRELFSPERLRENVSSHKDQSIEELVKDLMQEINYFSRDVSQSDDITIMALRYLRG